MSDHSRQPDTKDPERTSSRGLDWFVFFVADVQTGFGPFVAVYLTTQRWTQVDIGIVLTVGGLVSLCGQIPGGLLLDYLKAPRRAAAVAIVLICASALMLALWPTYLGVMTSRILQAGASCVLGPAIVALSLGLVGRERAGERFGRNASFASIGTGLTAAVMGLCGYYISNQAVFFITAAIGIPALISLHQIRQSNRALPSGQTEPSQHFPSLHDIYALATTHRPILIFCICVFLFHLANAGVLPLIAGNLTQRSSATATPLIAVAMVVPQFLVALISPTIGRKTAQFGRRKFLIAGFSILAVRIGLTAVASDPIVIVAIQILDGASAAIMGVLVPLTIADLTRQTGRLNLVQGLAGTAMGLGASISTTLGGFLADRYTTAIALIGFALIAVTGLVTIIIAMPETRHRD